MSGGGKAALDQQAADAARGECVKVLHENPLTTKPVHMMMRPRKRRWAKLIVRTIRGCQRHTHPPLVFANDAHGQFSTDRGDSCRVDYCKTDEKWDLQSSMRHRLLAMTSMDTAYIWIYRGLSPTDEKAASIDPLSSHHHITSPCMLDGGVGKGINCKPILTKHQDFDASSRSTLIKATAAGSHRKSTVHPFDNGTRWGRDPRMASMMELPALVRPPAHV